MKRYNYKVNETTISELTNRGKCLKLFRSLGYDLEPSAWLPPENWPETRAIYRGKDDQHLQTWFFEMDTITQARIYPIIADIVKTFPQNLLLFADTYDHIFLVAASATSLSKPAIGLGQNSVFPSIKIHRIDRKANRQRDRLFLEELTRTIDQDPCQYIKICHAFKRLNWFNPALSKAISKTNNSDSLAQNLTNIDPSELFHQLRAALRNKRHIAYSGTWQQKVNDIILPVLELLGFHVEPGKVTQKDCLQEPDLFLYRMDPEKPGATPSSGCIELTGKCNPDIIARKLIFQNFYQKMLATDGRIWRVYYDTGNSLDIIDLDLFSILHLDRERVNTPGPELETFLQIPSGCWQIKKYRLDAVNPANLSKVLTSAFRDIFDTETACSRGVKESMFQLAYLLYGELSGRIKPIFKERWNIPELNYICRDPNQWDGETLKTLFITHLRTLRELDRFTNISAQFFHSSAIRNNSKSVVEAMEELPAEIICEILHELRKLITSFCPDLDYFGSLSVYQFAQLAELLLDQKTPVWPKGLETAMAEQIETRFKVLISKNVKLNEPDAPKSNHLRRLLSESMFRMHIVDAHAGTGVRLLRTMFLLEQLFLSNMDESSFNPIHPRLPELRNLVIRDSHDNKIMLDHSLLSGLQLLRLQINQHCLYGVINAGELRVISAIMNLATGLSGIRFPFTAHHFHPATTSARDRLSREYSGDLPDQIQEASGQLSGMIAAARWFAEQELDLEAFGPNFAFTRAQFRMIMQRVIDFNDEHPDEQGLPLEFVFAWVFYNRLTGGADPGQPGTGFDWVIN